MTIQIVKVNYRNIQQLRDLAKQLVAYSADPMGGGEALPDAQALQNIVAMSKKSFAHSFLAYQENLAVGFCNCFESFSSFAGKPVVNIHDIAVSKDFRGKGIGTQLLQAVERHAAGIHAAKLTLEVLEGNTTAQRSYQQFGFQPYELGEGFGCAQFWQKSLE